MLVIKTDLENQKRIEEKLKDEGVTIIDIKDSYKLFELGGEMEEMENEKILNESLWLLPFLQEEGIIVEYYLERQDGEEILQMDLFIKSEELSDLMEFENIKNEANNEIKSIFMFPNGLSNKIKLKKIEDPSYKIKF